ncbi:MAG: hypothetical protein OXF89_05065 [Rhodospirillaceae bacterium]|nr:hypothetical protein [Rhodospirillaceae bacterium]
MSDPVPNDAARIIEAFGGIRPMAKKLGLAVTTVQGWKERNAIPIRRLDEIRAAAVREGIDLAAAAAGPGGPAGSPLQSPARGGAGSPPEDRGTTLRGGGGSAPGADEGAGPGRAEAEPLRAEKVVHAPTGVKEAEGAAAGPTVEAAQAKPAGRERAFAFGLGFAGMLVVGALIGWAAADRFAGPGTDPATAGVLETRLAAAEKDAADARAAAAAAGARAAAQAGALAERLDALAAATATLDRKLLAATEGNAALAPLGAAVEALQAEQEKLRLAIAAVQADGRSEQFAADLAGLKADVDALRRAVAAAAERPAGREGADEATQAALDRLSKGLAALSDEVAAFDRERLAKAEGILSGLAARIAAAETRLRSVQAGGGAAGIVVALGQLRAAAASGRPYGAALAAAQQLVGDGDAAAVLEALEPAAAAGAPVLPVLQREFDALAARLVASAGPAQGEGWIERAWNKLKSTVVVRRTGRNVAGDSAAALVAQTEVRLADGDLARAVALVRRMPAAARDSAADWLARAERRAGVDAALARLDALMPALYGGAAPGGAGSGGKRR